LPRIFAPAKPPNAMTPIMKMPAGFFRKEFLKKLRFRR
jgi:hypothetical protein